MERIVGCVGSDPAKAPIQSLVPAALAFRPELVQHDVPFPEDSYFLTADNIRFGWIGDAVAQDMVVPAQLVRGAPVDPTAPAWTAPRWLAVAAKSTSTVRCPMLSFTSPFEATVAFPPRPDASSISLQPALHWQRVFNVLIKRATRDASTSRSPIALDGFITDEDDQQHIGTLVAMLLAAAAEVSKFRAHHAPPITILLQGSRTCGPPPITRKPPAPYTMRSCSNHCRRCDVNDHMLKAFNIDHTASLEQLCQFSEALTSPSSGWSPHYEPVDVFRVPEESTPACRVEDIPADLRRETQEFFDAHATNLPTSITAKSPHYRYDHDGGVILNWIAGATPPSNLIHTRTRPGPDRQVIYGELLKDLCWSDLRRVPISSLRASVVLFVVWHRVTGEPRICAAPYESNTITAEAKVRYGVLWDLFSSDKLVCGCRGDIGRGFKHCKLARQSAVHVAFILDGIALLPLSVYFGLRDGPRIFCTTLQQDLDDVPNIPVPRGHAVSPLVTWVDDLARLASECTLMVRIMLSLARHLAARGYKCPPKKWFMLPAALQKFIGYILDPPRAGTRISRSMAVKVATTARDILRVASTAPGSPVTPLQEATALTHFGRLAAGAHHIPLLAFARATVDRSLADGVWRPGARELLTTHAIDAPLWHALRSTDRSPITDPCTMLLSTDASLAVHREATTASGHAAPDDADVDAPASIVGGGGHWSIVGHGAHEQHSNPGPYAASRSADHPPRHFFSINIDTTRFGLRHSPASSTWAEALTSAYGLALAEQLIVEDKVPIKVVAMKLDAATVVARAPKCSTEALQVSGFYAFIHRFAMAYALRLYITWHSRQVTDAKMADAVSSVAVNLWLLLPQWRVAAAAIFDGLRIWAGRHCPALLLAAPVHLLADHGSSLAPAYASGSVPDSDERASALRSVPTWTAGSRGFLGLPDAVPWGGRILALTLVPTSLPWLPALARQALAAEQPWVALCMAVLVPDLLAMLQACMSAGVVLVGSWSISPGEHWLLAPDSRTPLFPSFPSAWLLLCSHLDDSILALLDQFLASASLPFPPRAQVEFRKFPRRSLLTLDQLRSHFASQPVSPPSQRSSSPGSRHRVATAAQIGASPQQLPLPTHTRPHPIETGNSGSSHSIPTLPAVNPALSQARLSTRVATDAAPTVSVRSSPLATAALLPRATGVGAESSAHPSYAPAASSSTPSLRLHTTSTLGTPPAAPSLASAPVHTSSRGRPCDASAAPTYRLTRLAAVRPPVRPESGTVPCRASHAPSSSAACDGSIVNAPAATAPGERMSRAAAAARRRARSAWAAASSTAQQPPVSAARLHAGRSRSGSAHT